MDNKIEKQDVLDTLSNQMNNYSVKLAHSNALTKKRENYMKN